MDEKLQKSKHKRTIISVSNKSSKIEFFSGEKKSPQMNFDVYRHRRNQRGKLSKEKK